MKLFLNFVILTFFLFTCVNICLHAGKPGEGLAHIENTYLHTDRDLYVAGEHIQYKSYLLYDNNEKDIKSNFLYVALRNQGKVIKSTILPVGRHYSSGNLYLPDTLSTGYYELVSHTNWMRNMGEDYYFRKPILIINRFDQHPERILDPADGVSDIEVDFYPESGSLVEELNNSVLIKTSGGVDNALRDVKILQEYDTNDKMSMPDTIREFKLNTHGFARFDIIPSAKHNYYAAIEGFDELFELPEIRTSGCILRVNEEEEGGLSINILASEDRPNVEWLRVNHDDNIIHEERVYDLPHKTLLALEEETFPEGLITIQIGARGWGPIAQRYWYNLEEKPSGVFLKTDKQVYNKRDNVSLTIDGTQITDEYALLSLAVVKPESLSKQNVSSAGYKRAIDIAQVFNYPQSKAVTLFGNMTVEELNDYLIGNYYDSFIDDNTNEDSFNKKYIVETDGIIVSGRITDNETGLPMEDARVILNKPNTIINLLYTYTDNEGVFHFILSDFFHDNELYFLVDPETIDADYEIEVFDKFEYKTPAITGGFPLLNKKMDYIEKSQDIVRVNKAYGINQIKEIKDEHNQKSPPPVLFSKPNRTIYTENFVLLDSLAEITREIVHGWQLRQQQDGKYVSILTCESERKRLPESPVYFLDGVITYDINKLAHLSSKKINRLEIHNYQWFHGEMFFPGIIGIFTDNNDYLTTLAHRTRTSMIKESLQKPTSYEVPEYNNEQNNDLKMPDFRQTLYWNADLEVKKGQTKKISFYTGDLSGKYLINITGITESGNPVNIIKEIKIN